MKSNFQIIFVEDLCVFRYKILKLKKRAAVTSPTKERALQQCVQECMKGEL